MTIATQDREFAEQKLQSVISLCDKIAAGDWPYLDSKDALLAIGRHFRSQLRNLTDLKDDDADDIKAACYADARSVVARYHTFIGVILRSSNVRNPFEGFAPLKKIASQLLGRQYRVIFSSEWSYTPFAYPIPIASLEKFVFVGLPACESPNSLLLPLAGHELGHALWRQHGRSAKIKKALREELFRVFLKRSSHQNELFDSSISEEEFEREFSARSNWKRPFELAVRHCEEIFCDVLGCWLFGEAYLHAFRYMLHPELGPRSAEDYPTNRARAECLDKATSCFHGLDLGIRNLFSAPRPAHSNDLREADEASLSVIPLIMAEIDQMCSGAGLVKPELGSKGKALSRIKALIPTEKLTTVADVINAGWELRLNLNTWDIPGVNDQKKLSIINDLILKSFEINELEQRR